ncbi:hypothetical protein H8E88_15170 [candidate division KSB1 bacterium]|nr:hypothetical protein [candidate division KSB1 bacterium]
MKRLIFTILGVLIYCGLSAQEIPQKISYQGKLLENGIPVTGTKSITFTIDSWSETKTVSVSDGLYSVTLGETTPIPISIFDNSTSISLQITVAGTTLSPQTDILSVAYAYKAEKAVDAEEIDGNPVSGNPSLDDVLKWSGSQWTPQPDETSPTGSASGDLSDNYPNPTVAKIQNNPVSSNTPTDEQVLKWDGTEWLPDNDGITLPYAGLYSGSATNTFQIENGTSATSNNVLYVNNMSSTGNLATFEISGSSTGDVLKLYNDGGGRGLFIDQNQSNIGFGIEVNSWSNTHEGIYIDMDGNAGAGEFLADNSTYTLYSYNGGSGVAAEFDGDIEVTGTINKGAVGFKIDHPINPENKFLHHSCIESPDMMNVYNGNIVLDINGEAIVELPDWFDVLNKDFRYQLTCIGGFSPVFISEKISGNSFKIAGGTSGMEVSWQITGIRQDPYANQNRIQVEVEKTENEKGHYLHYKEYKQPIEKSIKVVRHPEILEKLNK